jgi:hypothetical protein
MAALVQLCEENLGALTFQRVEAIEGVLRDVVQCPAPWPAAADFMTEPDVDEWDGDRVKERLGEFVTRRHRIAHSGDLRPDGAAARPIRRDYVREAANVIYAVGVGVDDEIANLGAP